MALNLEFRNLQSQLQVRQATWVAAITPLTQLSEEKKRLYLGAVPQDGDTLESLEKVSSENFQAFRLASAATQPVNTAAAVSQPNLLRFPNLPILFRSIDWRNVNGRNYVSPVRDQGGCGSCVAFGTCAAIEARWRILANLPDAPIDLSEAHLFYCLARSEGRNCSNGWWPDKALAKCSSPGVTEESCYPYVAGDQNCSNLCANWALRSTYVDGWHKITDIGQMKTWLLTMGPLSTCFTVYDDFFSYSSGVYHHVTGDVAGGHCVCVIGFDDLQQCWICRNSWGTSWGDHGYFKIAYGECGINAAMYAVEGVSSYKTVVSEEAIGTPAIANLNDTVLALAWTGTDSQHHLNVAGARGNWSSFGGKVILGETSFDGPGLAAGAGKVFLAWAGTDSEHHLNVLQTTDCVHFVNKVTLGDTARFGPALAWAFNKLFIAWVGTDSGKRLNVMSSPDGIHWGGKVTLNESSDSAVGLSFANGKLYLTWQGTDAGSHLNMLESTDGTNWSGKVTLGDTSGFKPAVTQSANGLMLAWTGTDASHHLNVLHSSGAPSALGSKITLTDTAANGVCAVLFQGKALITWTGTDSAHHVNVMQVL